MTIGPIRIIRRAGPTHHPAKHEIRHKGNHHHAPRFALDVRQGIERQLAALVSRIIPAQPRRQRVRGLMARGGKKKGKVPEETKRNRFGSQLIHRSLLDARGAQT